SADGLGGLFDFAVRCPLFPVRCPLFAVRCPLAPHPASGHPLPAVAGRGATCNRRRRRDELLLRLRFLRRCLAALASQRRRNEGLLRLRFLLRLAALASRRRRNEGLL